MNEGKEYRAELPFHIYTDQRNCLSAAFIQGTYIRIWRWALVRFLRAGVMTTNDQRIGLGLGWDGIVVWIHFTDRGVGIVLALLS